MNQLPEQFTEKGFTYKQVRRNEYAAIYKQTWGNEGSPAYEVVIPQIAKKRFIDGKWRDSEPYEAYPSSSQWGMQGWTTTTEDRANQRFQEITEKARSVTRETQETRP